MVSVYSCPNVVYLDVGMHDLDRRGDDYVEVRALICDSVRAQEICVFIKRTDTDDNVTAVCNMSALITLINFIGQRMLVGFKVKKDLDFLINLADKYAMVHSLKEGYCIDILSLARVNERISFTSLEQLRTYFKIPTGNEIRAFRDLEVIVMLFNQFLERYESFCDWLVDNSSYSAS